MSLPNERVGASVCPVCGGELVAVPAPTDEQRAAAADRENRVPLPPHVDSATKEQLAELGALYTCASCGYKTRIKAAA